MKESRAASGLPLIEIAFRLREELPHALWVSTDTIRKIELKSDPNPVLAAALARIYGQHFDAWPEGLRTEVEQVERMLEATRLLLEVAA